MKQLLTMLALLTALASGSRPGTYYVSPKGDDSDPGTRERPFRTIQKAADVLKPGDTCLIRSGTYREAVELRKSGTEGRVVPGFRGKYRGRAPDIGAYEYGAEPWTAGITWDPEKVPGHVPAGFHK